jgi:ABC-2 type transport system ATP-binding protein
MRAICGLILPTEGTVEVDKKKIGKDISFPDSVGLLLENPSFLPSYTAFENLKLLTSIKGLVSDEKITETLKAVGLEPKDKRKYKKFSLGIIILDEPFNALDEDGNKLILELLMQLRMQGKLIILSCHDKQELEMLSDKIFLIKSGKICKEESA